MTGQGTEQIKSQKLNYKLITFFILPPTKSELFNRLKNRDMKDKNIVEERMKQFDEDIEHWENYDFVVINDNLEKCYNEIIKLINKKVENLETSYDKNVILNHIKKLRN
jgi:Guanylate kinase